jgi:geranylgeranyl diphosphate synthase type II
MDAPSLLRYLRECRALVLGEIEGMIPKDTRYRGVLYDLVLDYPLRDAKAMRPALCIATSRALGGRLEAVLPSAAVIELYHNAFLIHDDVEDQSEKRRDLPTLHGMYGVPIAVNVGDAMLALALGPLLDNMATLGMGAALRILQAVARMARESAEGQAIELDWVRRCSFELCDADYVHMVEKKTSFYSFITPMLVGAIVAGAEPARLQSLQTFASHLGVAFQIQDDILNLAADEGAYGKEIGGDLWEGKHTLILMHMMRSAAEEERSRAREILRKPRPGTACTQGRGGDRTLSAAAASRLRALTAELAGKGELTERAHGEIERAIGELSPSFTDGAKTSEDVAYLFALVQKYKSIEYARGAARIWASSAAQQLDKVHGWIPPSVHRDFIDWLVDYVIERDK